MILWRKLATIACVAVVTCVSGCSSGPSNTQHYVSGAIQGQAQKINLDEVQKAFFETKGTDFDSQMKAFEKRVNEIYDGQGVVALDATRNNNLLKVTGFIAKTAKPGLQPGDDVLFTIEQTGDVVQNEMPYRIAGNDGRTYYQGSHSILDNPFVQMLVLSHVMGGMGGGWGGRYYTPYSSYGGLMGYRTSWRQTPQYAQQQTTNNSFFSRFKTNSSGGLQSSTKFGGGMFSSGPATTNRTWGGAPATSGASSSPWGGMRSSGFGRSGFSSGRSWGGMRRGR